MITLPQGKTYLVGGAVRDELLSLPIGEKDYVVVGATPEDMIKAGFRPVGQDFPVFLHPRTHEEYALARTERKVAPGYHGFVFHADQHVTLEEDLSRRDLTINAMARDETDGRLVDPFGGQRDLQDRVLRHIDEHFAEDPLRLLRLARFAARFKPLGFTIHPETLTLCKRMVHNGELDTLQPERVYTETIKALAESDPGEYFIVLQRANALEVVYPEVACAMQHRPVLAILAEAVRLTEFPQPHCKTVRRATKETAQLRFIALAQACGDPTQTPQPCSRCASLCQRLRAPNLVARLARRACEVREALCHWQSLDAPARLAHLERLDAWRSKEQIIALAPVLLAELQVCGASPDQWDALLGDMTRALDVATAPLLQQGLRGEAMGKALHQARLAALSAPDNQPTAL